MGAQARLRENRDFETIISQKHRIMVNSHVQLFNSRGYERLCTKSHLSFQAPASPPDVRRGFALPEAAKKTIGAVPLGSAYGPEVLGKARTKGIAQSHWLSSPAGQSPASHRGGEAGANDDQDFLFVVSRP